MIYLPFIFLCYFAEGNEEVDIKKIYCAWVLLITIYLFVIDKSDFESISENLIYILISFTSTFGLESSKYFYAFTLCMFLQSMVKLSERSISMSFTMLLLYVIMIPFLPKTQIDQNMQIMSICWAELCHFAIVLLWKIL